MNTGVIIIFICVACILPLHAQEWKYRHQSEWCKLLPSIKRKNLMGISGGVTAPIYLQREYFNASCGYQLNFSPAQLRTKITWTIPTELHTHHELKYLPWHLAFGRTMILQFFIRRWASLLSDR